MGDIKLNRQGVPIGFTRKFRVGDAVAYVNNKQWQTDKIGVIVDIRGFMTRVVPEFLVLTKTQTVAKGFVDLDNPVVMVAKGSNAVVKDFPQRSLVSAGDYIRELVDKYPSVVNTPLFARFADPDLKTKYPEAGADFGFFDVHKTNECNMVKGFFDFVNESSEASTVREENKGSRKVWRLPDGRAHRLDGPAIESVDGTREWYVNGRRHRNDGPAIEYADGTKYWYVDGKQLREDGPSIESSDGSLTWYVDGKLHREDGPAYEGADGTRVWWVDGKVLSEKEFEKRFPEAYRKWWESQVGKPWFREAPKEIKDEHPESGADFGFFDSKRVKTFESFVKINME